MALERLQKILARAGYGSRRHCETLITDGRVQVDAVTVTQLGSKADPVIQKVTVDQQPIRMESFVYFLLNKPKGMICSSVDPAGRPLAVQLPGIRERIFSVGRLDEETSGLLLLTNDGGWANLLAHPRYKIEKTYQARVVGTISNEALAKLRGGVHLSEGRTAPAWVEFVKPGQKVSQLSITIREGMNRQVRRMLAAVDLKCIDLKRTSIGPLHLEKLEPGQYRALRPREVDKMRTMSSEAASPKALAAIQDEITKYKAMDDAEGISRLRDAHRRLAQQRWRMGLAPEPHAQTADDRKPWKNTGREDRRTSRGQRLAERVAGGGGLMDRSVRARAAGGGPLRPERSPHPERGRSPERGERGDREDRGERGERAERPERGEQDAGVPTGHSERPGRGAPAGRPERGERGDRRDRGERGARPGRSERPAGRGRPAGRDGGASREGRGGGGSDRRDRPAWRDRPDRSDRAARPGRPDQSDRGGSRSERPASHGGGGGTGGGGGGGGGSGSYGAPRRDATPSPDRWPRANLNPQTDGPAPAGGAAHGGGGSRSNRGASAGSRGARDGGRKPSFGGGSRGGGGGGYRGGSSSGGRGGRGGPPGRGGPGGGGGRPGGFGGRGGAGGSRGPGGGGGGGRRGPGGAGGAGGKRPFDGPRKDSPAS